MSDRTGIEWTDHTFNPWIGCTKVSAGCANCYAQTLVEGRMGLQRWGNSPRTRTKGPWRDVLRWNRAAAAAGVRRRVFCASLCDVFEDAPGLDAIRAELWPLIDACFALDWQLLTKRPENIRRMLPAAWLAAPREHVWLGTSVENQAAADARIPALLEVPAAVRFLSCEPLLERVDLTGWGAASSSDEFAFEQPPGWEGYPWPEWVPADQRAQIEKFWNVRDGRGPRGWIDNQRVNRMPASGARVGARMRKGWAEVVPALSPEASKHGRWLHSWNNVGRVVTDDGETLYASAGTGPGWLSKWLQDDGKYRHRLHWVIAGGESGPGARPCDVAWNRSLVEQCKAAGVACFVKQLGRRPVARDRWDMAEPAFVAADAGGWDESQGPVVMKLRDRKGGDPAEWPEDLRVREFPRAGGR